MSIFRRLFGKRDKRNKTAEGVYEIVDRFMQASMLMVDSDKLHTPDKKMKLLAYNFGALLYLFQANDIDFAEADKIAIRFFKDHYNMSEEQAKEFVKSTVLTFRHHPEFSAFLKEGGETMHKWIVEGNQNAPLKLSKLLREK